MFILFGTFYECGGVSEEAISTYDNDAEANAYIDAYNEAKETHCFWLQEATETVNRRKDFLTIKGHLYFAAVVAEYERISGKRFSVERDKFSYSELRLKTVPENKKFDPNESIQDSSSVIPCSA